MIIESGMIIFAGLLFIFIKLPHRTRLWLLGHPLMLDVSVSVLAYVMHYGTFSGRDGSSRRRLDVLRLHQQSRLRSYGGLLLAIDPIPAL